MYIVLGLGRIAGRQRGRHPQVREERRLGHEVGNRQPRPLRHDGENKEKTTLQDFDICLSANSMNLSRVQNFNISK